MFALLEVICTLLMLRWHEGQRSLWFAVSTEVAGSVREAESAVLKFLSLGEENQRLTSRNIILEERVERLSRLITELTHDSTYAERAIMATAADSARLIAAKVIDARMSGRDNYIMIDRGTEDGVNVEMGVVSGQGVVGIVYEASAHHAVVMPVVHSNSSISCRLREAEYFGYLHWESGDLLTAVVDDIPRHAQVKAGDVVETSGFSAVFPAGLFVGKVSDVQDSEDGLAYTLRVTLGVDFGKIRSVVVIAPNTQTP